MKEQVKEDGEKTLRVYQDGADTLFEFNPPYQGIYSGTVSGNERRVFKNALEEGYTAVSNPSDEPFVTLRMLKLYDLSAQLSR